MGFFAIITLYQKLPLFRPPFSLPFHHSENLKPPQKFHNFNESRQTTQKKPPFRLQKAVVMFSLFVSLFLKLMLPQKHPCRVRRWGTRSSLQPLPKACRERFPGWALQLWGRIHIHKGKRIFSYQYCIKRHSYCTYTASLVESLETV